MARAEYIPQMNRSRGSGRNGGRGIAENGEEQNLWNYCLQLKQRLAENEAQAKVLSQTIVDMEVAYKTKEDANESMCLNWVFHRNSTLTFQ